MFYILFIFLYVIPLYVAVSLLKKSVIEDSKYVNGANYELIEVLFVTLTCICPLVNIAVALVATYSIFIDGKSFNVVTVDGKTKITFE